MKIQIKNSHRVFTGTTLLFALLFIAAVKVDENIVQANNTSGSQTMAKSLHIDVGILVMSEKVEVLRKFITGWREVRE